MPNKQVYYDIRTATLEDLPVLYEFEQEIMNTERPFDITLKPGPIHFYDLSALMLSSESEVMVAVTQDEIVGSAFVEIRNAQSFQQFEKYAYIGYAYVKPMHRGKGVLQQIVSVIKSWSKSRNITELRAEVYSENHRALRADEKLGFKNHLIEMRLAI